MCYEEKLVFVGSEIYAIIKRSIKERKKVSLFYNISPKLIIFILKYFGSIPRGRK